ncbi:MAG: helix-turn-helix transcriptional regulator [Rhizobiaceae bacterium]|nr:helix-turn-helix transcriptional regulator [Rhizobiaceae bacterium]
MSVYENMGINLRALCKQKPSISHVCNELGINRQQFAKYINGENFPRQKTLKKICDYFGVREIDLFMDPDSYLLDMDEKISSLVRKKEFQDILGQVLSPQETMLDDGLYLTYFRATSDPDWVIKSVTAIRKQSDRTEFRRLTGYNERKSSAWRLSLGSHRGLVLNRRGILYFAALDQRASQAPSLATMHWAPTDVSILTGKSIALTKSGADVCHVIMEKMPKSTSLLSVLRKSGAIGIKDGDLPVQIRQLFHNM